MIAWLSRTRFNYIDALGISICTIAISHGKWISAIALSFLMAVISMVAENKGGAK